MFFYFLVSLLCHFGPICPKYTTARSLLKLSSVKSLMPNCVSLSSTSFVMSLIFICPCHTTCTVFLYILIHLSLCSPPLTCSLFSCSCRLWSLLHTSSILSWDSTRGALMLLSSSPFDPAPSFSQELSFSSSAALSVVWLSSVDRKTQFRCVSFVLSYSKLIFNASKTGSYSFLVTM